MTAVTTITAITIMITSRPGTMLAAWVALTAGCAPSSGPFSDLIDEGWLVGFDDTRAALANVARPEPHVVIPEDAAEADYVRLALERNPAIRAAGERVRRLAQRIPQAKSLDDPVVRVAPFGEMAQTAAGEVGVMTSVSQRLPFPGKLDARGRIATRAAAEAAQELQRTRLAVVSDTRLAFWSYYDAARAIEVTERSRELLTQIRDVAESKLKAGAATQQDVLRASLELSNLANELIALRQRLTTAQAMLNRLIDRPINAAMPVPVARGLDQITFSLAELLAEAGRANPGLHGIRQRIEGFRERLALAKLNRWPDLNVSFNYNLVDREGLSSVANGDDQWWVGFGVNLPIWTQRLDAAEAEAIRGVLEGIASLDDEQNRVAFRVQDALARAESHQRQVVLVRDVILQQARQTVEASMSGYRAGRLEFLALVDNWRKLLDVQLMYHHILSQYEKSFAELQRTVGRDLPRASEEPQ